MESENVMYFGDGLPIGNSLIAAKKLFENAIDLLEKVGIEFNEKEELITLMNSIIRKADKRGLQEMSRTNINGKILWPLPEEYRPSRENEESNI